MSAQIYLGSQWISLFLDQVLTPDPRVTAEDGQDSLDSKAPPLLDLFKWLSLLTTIFSRWLL